ncbi:hypothetical protein C5167_007299 [Papaver somniferum]|uniref:putative disease resistance protein RGA3 n=1 Tax=Papaver somniferum TaxID=3469 RepID=UPI000E6F8061|nr:putative disease resistance protein RGA3 [Papaver somniferum]XP_026444196.1 putative disease resistance protein RGA3 [Papaver somniferum]RZC93486.1 hypothetical protein C5167_007299 [Papaver somniferum]
MADALLSYLINELGDVIKQEIEQEVRLVVGVRKEVKKLESTFMTLQAVLNEAEQRQMNEESVKIWLAKLKNTAYEMEDVLDEWGTEIQKSRLEKLKLVEDNGNQVPKLSSYFCSPISCVKQVVLRHDIAYKIKQIREALDCIKNERNQFLFKMSERPEKGPHVHERKETSSIIVDRPNIFGRDSDQELILNRLFGVESSTNQLENETRDPRIISIIGMGGLGKTTLAQLVFDHEKVKSHFKLPMWVCVSDPFDRIKVAKAIIRAAKEKDTHTSTWNLLFGELCESVKGKKFLLVLDDVWTNDPNNLKEFTHILDLGEQGSRILVTTRRETVASALNSYKHMLQGLNSDYSSLLLHRKAFHGKEKERSECLEDIGTTISKKCHGLPLALSLLGSLLNKKVNENHWMHVLDSKIWELKGFDHQKKLVYPIFLLSYDDLESQLKNCFLYCATFPKAFKIRKRTLVRLWMAHGFLYSSTDQAKDPELTGEEYFDELVDRSFFQDISTDDVGREFCCKMHDLVHDFAQFLTRDHCYDSYNNEDTFCSKQHGNPIHLSLIYDERDASQGSFLASIRKVDNVRTVQCRRHMDHSFSVDSLSSDLIRNLRNLRVLKLKGMGITHISNQIDKLIHLRYLDLSRNKNLTELPDSLCGLINLQTLKLKRCKSLIKLPKGVWRMIKLRNLDIRLAGLVYLPGGIRNWKYLQTLSTFIVTAAAEGCKLGELKHHKLLKDYLEIKGLGRLKSAEQASEAKLQTKSQLIELRLDFDSCEETLASTSSNSQIHQQSSEVLDVERLMESFLAVLQPHSNLKKLTISNYLGFKFPSWMGDIRALTNLRFLELYKCSNCTELPALGLLPSLEELVIKNLTKLRHIGVEIYGAGQCVTEVAFPKLITLIINGTKNLQVWEFGSREVQVGDIMPRVTSITLFGCTNLIALPPLNKLPSLETLTIRHAHQLTSICVGFYCIRRNAMSNRRVICQLNSFSSFPNLVTLDISYMASLEAIVLGVIAEGEKGDNNNEISVLPCLRILRALVCPELKSLRLLTKSLLPIKKIHLCNLKEFKIREEEDEDLSLLPCIRDLYLHWCPELLSFPRNLPNLSSLVIEECPSLISEDHRLYLPISPNLTSLEILEGPEGPEQSLVNPRDIARFKELQRLTLYANLDESFMFIPEYLQSLTKLKYLWIGNTSGMHDGGDWSILSHIPNIKINGKKINPSIYLASSSSSQI